jgi:2-haloacid dehalogenase
MRGYAHRRDAVAEIDFTRIEALTFDCYGTLIDWEAGIAAGLRRVLEPRGVHLDDDELLESYAHHEAELEAGEYLRYRAVLARALRAVAAEHGFEPGDPEVDAFAASVGDWPAFPDSRDALRDLRTRFRLGVITNCDDDLFAGSNVRLGEPFEWIVTAEQAGSYKPSPRNFDLAFERLGLPRDRIVHVAQSLYHDHVPAKAVGLRTVWINRRHGRPGSGATPPAAAAPDLTFTDMASFAERALR